MSVRNAARSCPVRVDQFVDELEWRRIAFQCREVAQYRDRIDVEHPVVLSTDKSCDVRRGHSRKDGRPVDAEYFEILQSPLALS